MNTPLFVPTEIDEHLIVDHGVDAALIGQTHQQADEHGWDYDEIAQRSHDVMHMLGQFVNHTHEG